jgi:hypothetical protein
MDVSRRQLSDEEVSIILLAPQAFEVDTEEKQSWLPWTTDWAPARIIDKCAAGSGYRKWWCLCCGENRAYDKPLAGYGRARHSLPLSGQTVPGLNLKFRNKNNEEEKWTNQSYGNVRHAD